MIERSVPPRPGWGSQVRLLLLAAAGVTAIGAAVVLGMRDASEPPAAPQVKGGIGPATAPPPTPPAAAVPATPGFDIVRVNPRGDAVLAGHASPGAEVRIEEAGREIGRVRADERGEWVFVPAEPLPPGGREFSLTARSPDGRETRSDGTVLLMIPGRGETQTPVAVLSTPEAPPRVLQSGAGNAQGPSLQGPSLEAAEYDERGALRLAGRAPPDAAVRIYLDDKLAGDARADPQGRWTFSPGTALAEGNHRVRLDEIGPDGRVIARAIAPLPRQTIASAGASTDLTAGHGAAGHVVVQPGETLWRLARNAYGSGTRYTLLYAANRSQIQDPARIYPGQAFAVPALRVAR